MDPQQIIANFEINLETPKTAAISYVSVFLKKINPDEAEALTEQFTNQYEAAIRLHEKEDRTDLARLYRLLVEFKPALVYSLQPGKDFDLICDAVAESFNIILDRIRRQINEGKPARPLSGSRVPHLAETPTLRYYCTVCKESFEIPPEMHAKILNSDEKLSLPKHHDKEMVIRIGEPAAESSESPEREERPKIEVYPAELLMQHTNSGESAAEYLTLTSVGIDVGSSTTHLVFSRLSLKRERSFFNMTNRFLLINRDILYEGNIIFTPLLDPMTIDIEGVVSFCKNEYEKAGFTPEDVDTGAVIVTGETAKKQNAAVIVERLSSESGKFVSASAGPNFESMLAAMGSGIVDLSRAKQNTILNVDIGGGTSNLAIASKGEVYSTACINVGGRLLGIDESRKVWRVDEPTTRLMGVLGMHYSIGDTISDADVKKIAREYAKALVEVMRQPATSHVAKMLMMTEDLDFSVPIDEISFSGGIGELIYQTLAARNISPPEGAGDRTSQYEDIGWYLAEEILEFVDELGIPVLEPEYKIRATVIGAGAFSLSVSGSTCYYDSAIKLPLENVPVVTINLKFQEILAGGEVSLRKFKEMVALALSNYNLMEGTDTFALYFDDINIRANLSLFARALERALPNSVAKGKLILIILGFDGAKMLGLTLTKETAIKGNLFCLDELFLETGDWIDIGRPLGESQAFPVTIKSLVFNQPSSKQDITAEETKTNQKSPVDDPTKLVGQATRVIPESGSEKTTAIFPAGTRTPDQILEAFAAFQAEHRGYEALLVLSPEGELEFGTDPLFCTPGEAHGIFRAWQDQDPAFTIGDARFPILTWDDAQFAAKNPGGKGIVVGSKTKSNRYALLKVDPGTKFQPNIAALAAMELNRWAWNLI